MTEQQKRLARLEQKWAQIPKDLVDRFTAALVGDFTRFMEGDRPRREYAAKARASGNTRAAEIAEGLVKHDYYDDVLPEDMARYVEQLKPIPNPPHRPRKWTEAHFARLDKLVAEGFSPTGGAKAILRQDGVQLADPKGTAGGLVKAWKKSRGLGSVKSNAA